MTRRHHDLKLSNASRRAVYVVVALTWTTGLAWLILHYYLQRHGDFGLMPHPLEPWALKVHGAGAFASLWLAGLLGSSHVRRAWRRRQRPLSGVAVASTAVVLIVTGYLLYYTGDDVVRARVALVHWLLGLTLPLLLAVHIIRLRRRGAAASRRGP